MPTSGVPAPGGSWGWRRIAPRAVAEVGEATGRAWRPVFVGAAANFEAAEAAGIVDGRSGAVLPSSNPARHAPALPVPVSAHTVMLPPPWSPAVAVVVFAMVALPGGLRPQDGLAEALREQRQTFGMDAQRRLTGPGAMVLLDGARGAQFLSGSGPQRDLPIH